MDKILTVAGIAIITFGVVLGFLSYRVNSQVMGQAGLGIAIISPEKDSPEWREKERRRVLSDRLFYWSIGLTITGGVLQIAAVLMPKAFR